LRDRISSYSIQIGELDLVNRTEPAEKVFNIFMRNCQLPISSWNDKEWIKLSQPSGAGKTRFFRNLTQAVSTNFWDRCHPMTKIVQFDKKRASCLC
jgi:hypothetical protein